MYNYCNYNDLTIIVHYLQYIFWNCWNFWMIEKLTIVCVQNRIWTYNLNTINIYNPFYTHVCCNIFSYING